MFNEKLTLASIELVVDEAGSLSIDTQTIDAEKLIKVLETTKSNCDLVLVKDIVKWFNERIVELDIEMTARYE